MDESCTLRPKSLIIKALSPPARAFIQSSVYSTNTLSRYIFWHRVLRGLFHQTHTNVFRLLLLPRDITFPMTAPLIFQHVWLIKNYIELQNNVTCNVWQWSYYTFAFDIYAGKWSLFKDVDVQRIHFPLKQLQSISTVTCLLFAMSQLLRPRTQGQRRSDAELRCDEQRF